MLMRGVLLSILRYLFLTMRPLPIAVYDMAKTHRSLNVSFLSKAACPYGYEKALNGPAYKGAAIAFFHFLFRFLAVRAKGG